MSNQQEPLYDHGGLLAFLFSMATVIVFFIYIVAVYPGIDLLENIQDPSQGEASSQSKKVDVSGIKEPWKPNEDMVTHGQALFAMNCASCHGAEGRGDGVAGAGLNPKPRNLVTGPWKKGGGYLGHFDVMTNGIPGTSMMAYGHLSLNDRWALVQFVESITQAKGKETPEQIEAFAKTAK